MTTQELHAVKKELADISAFVRERVTPLAEERTRLKEAIVDISEAEKRIRRRALLEPGSGSRPVVDGGLYDGFDALDLAVVKSLHRTAQLYGVGAGVTVGAESRLDEGAFLGDGVTILASRRVGRGVIVISGSVITQDIPDEAIAAGVPARLIRRKR